MVEDSPTPPRSEDSTAGATGWRLLTDHPITQLPWWGERLRVLPSPGHGTVASLRIAVRALWEVRRFDGFISANVRTSLVIGLMKRLLGRRRPALVLTELRLDDARPDMAWRAKRALQRVGYGAADAFCVSSRREARLYAERLRLPLERFHFVPWHTNVLEPAFHPPAGAAFLAAGRTGRDWMTLAAAAEGLPVPITVICAAADAARVHFPANVTVHTDVPYATYRELLLGAAGVIVPLEEHQYSSGQVVVLEAMALGKAVIAPRVLGTEDYIDDGVDGLLVPPGDAAALRGAIARLSRDPALAERLGRAGLAKIGRQHTLEAYARRVVDITGAACAATARRA